MGLSACLLSAATVGVVVAAGLQSADVATTGEKLRSVATFVLFLLIVAAVLLVLQMKNQTENCFKGSVLSRNCKKGLILRVRKLENK